MSPRARDALVREGSLKHREDIVDGPENAPEAFLGMLGGRNFGKLLVRGELNSPSGPPELACPG
jgi:NADPH-dependent curcumin reductase CurA